MAGKRAAIGASKRRKPFPFKAVLLWCVKGAASLSIVVLLGLLIIKVRDISWQPMPVASYSIQTPLVFQAQADVDELLEPTLGQSLLTLDLTELKAQLEALPWLRSVSIHKDWPSQLIINAIEYQPVAAWNQNQILNEEGHPLIQPKLALALSSLTGPEGSAPEVMSQYLQFSQVFSSVDERVQSVTLKPRGAWEIGLASGLEVRLGVDDVLERSRRVLSVLSAPSLNKNNIHYIDARYPNGVALMYKEESLSEAQNDLST